MACVAPDAQAGNVSCDSEAEGPKQKMYRTEATGGATYSDTTVLEKSMSTPPGDPLLFLASLAHRTKSDWFTHDRFGP